MQLLVTPYIINKGIIFPGFGQWTESDIKFLLLGAVIFIIALVFKGNSQIQSENE